MRELRSKVLFGGAVILPLILSVLCGYFFALTPLLVITAILCFPILFCFFILKTENTGGTGPGLLVIALYFMVLLLLMWGTALGVRHDEISGLVDWSAVREDVSRFWKNLLRK